MNIQKSTRIERRLAAKNAKRAHIKNDWGKWELRFEYPDVPPTNLKGLTRGWCNNIYAVQEYWNDIHPALSDIKWVKLMIRSHDSRKIGWAELQRIKNELYSPETVAIQLFPAESELIDFVNMYWLYLVPDAKRAEFKKYID